MQVAEAIKAGGIDVIEVTMTTPNALKVIEEVAGKYGDQVLIGVGSVLDAETCRMAILSGAQFVVGPCLDRAMIEMAHRYDKPVLPGAFTPTEIKTAWDWGADLVKVFPADVAGQPVRRSWGRCRRSLSADGGVDDPACLPAPRSVRGSSLIPKRRWPGALRYFTDIARRCVP